MIRRFFRLIFLSIVTLVLIILFAPSLIKGAGNTLITSMNDTAAQGIAQIIPHAQGKGADLQIKLDGLSANTNYYVSLDEGQCGGTVLFNVGKISTDSNGAATATLSLNDLRNALQKGLWLDVHQGTDASGLSVACGQIISSDSILGQSTVSADSTSVVTPAATVPTGVTNTNTGDTTSGTTSSEDTLTARGVTHGAVGFPDTGVAPAKGGSYDNYTFPRKY